MSEPTKRQPVLLVLSTYGSGPSLFDFYGFDLAQAEGVTVLSESPDQEWMMPRANFVAAEEMAAAVLDLALESERLRVSMESTMRGFEKLVAHMKAPAAHPAAPAWSPPDRAHDARFQERPGKRGKR